MDIWKPTLDGRRDKRDGSENQFKFDNTSNIIMALASSMPNHSYDAIKSHRRASTYKRLVTELISTCRSVVSNISSSSISGISHHTTPRSRLYPHHHRHRQHNHPIVATSTTDPSRITSYSQVTHPPLLSVSHNPSITYINSIASIYQSNSYNNISQSQIYLDFSTTCIQTIDAIIHRIMDLYLDASTRK